MRRVEILINGLWCQGTIKDLHNGVIFRLREPNGLLVGKTIMVAKGVAKPCQPYGNYSIQFEYK